MTSSVVTKVELEEKYGRSDDSADKSNRSERGPNQVKVLCQILGNSDLFHSDDGTAYADIRVNDHRETWLVRSSGFRRWLCQQYYERTKRAPNSNAMQSVLNLAEASAQFDGPKRKVTVRVAGFAGKLYLDLADDAWRAVEVDANGWRIVCEPPVRFRRSRGMLPLPDPAPGESIEILRRFLNVRKESEFILAVAWILAAHRDQGPYPVLVLSGEQGSAKSTFASVLRGLVDPNSAPLRALPREDRDLFIAASNGHALVFDNVSRLPAWISDTLCRLATGGGFAVRQLYTDQDEMLFDAARPVILNGIEDIVNRPDLADRALFLTLDPIPEHARMTEKELRRRLDQERPKILGALLDGVATGLSRIADTKLRMLPRMADFATWVTACETAFWNEGTFLSAYSSNRDEAVDNVIEADPVGPAVRLLMASRAEWSGTSTHLLASLSEAAGEQVRNSKDWPTTPRALAGRLRRAAPVLRMIGIDIAHKREGRSRTRNVYISNNPDFQRVSPSIPSAASDCDRTGPSRSGDADGADGADAKFVSYSHEAAEERAAIYEYEAGLQRDVAEFSAFADKKFQ